jgi:hypothetical protein
VGYSPSGLFIDIVGSAVARHSHEVRLNRQTVVVTLREEHGTGDAMRIEEKHLLMGPVPGLKAKERYSVVVQDGQGRVLMRGTFVAP